MTIREKLEELEKDSEKNAAEIAEIKGTLKRISDYRNSLTVWDDETVEKYIIPRVEFLKKQNVKLIEKLESCEANKESQIKEEILDNKDQIAIDTIKYMSYEDLDYEMLEHFEERIENMTLGEDRDRIDNQAEYIKDAAKQLGEEVEEAEKRLNDEEENLTGEERKELEDFISESKEFIKKSKEIFDLYMDGEYYWVTERIDRLEESGLCDIEKYDYYEYDEYFESTKDKLEKKNSGLEDKIAYYEKRIKGLDNEDEIKELKSKIEKMKSQIDKNDDKIFAEEMADYKPEEFTYQMFERFADNIEHNSEIYDYDEEKTFEIEDEENWYEDYMENYREESREVPDLTIDDFLNESGDFEEGFSDGIDRGKVVDLNEEYVAVRDDSYSEPSYELRRRDEYEIETIWKEYREAYSDEKFEKVISNLDNIMYYYYDYDYIDFLDDIADDMDSTSAQKLLQSKELNDYIPEEYKERLEEVKDWVINKISKQKYDVKSEIDEIKEEIEDDETEISDLEEEKEDIKEDEELEKNPEERINEIDNEIKALIEGIKEKQGILAEKEKELQELEEKLARITEEERNAYGEEE